MDYQIALLSNGANVHIAQDGVTLCDTRYAPDSFDTVGTLAQAKNAANTTDARRPCEDCIERAHELLDEEDEEQDDQTTPQRRRFLHIGQAVKAGQIASSEWRKAPFVTGEVIAETPNANPSLHMYTVRVEGTGDIVQVSRLDSGRVGHDYREPEVQEAPKAGPLRRPRWLPHLTEEAQSLLASAGDLHASIKDLEAATSQVRTMRDDTIRRAISAGATMADVARQLDLTYQAIARIRDRG